MQKLTGNIINEVVRILYALPWSQTCTLIDVVGSITVGGGAGVSRRKLLGVCGEDVIVCDLFEQEPGHECRHGCSVADEVIGCRVDFQAISSAGSLLRGRRHRERVVGWWRCEEAGTDDDERGVCDDEGCESWVLLALAEGVESHLGIGVFIYELRGLLEAGEDGGTVRVVV